MDEILVAIVMNVFGVPIKFDDEKSTVPFVFISILIDHQELNVLWSLFLGHAADNRS